VIQRFEQRRHVFGGGLRLGRGEIERPAGVTVTGHDEGPVVDATLGPEALGQAPAPCPLLAAGLVVGPGADVLQALEGGEPARIDEPGADEYVLVGEGQHRPAELGGDDRLQHLVPLGVALDRSQAPQQARGAPDPLRGAERETDQLVGLLHLGDQDPDLGLLGQQTDVEPGRAVGNDIGHLSELRIREGGAVLGLDFERHAAVTLLTKRDPGLLV